jgi:hypothetical protein
LKFCWGTGQHLTSTPPPPSGGFFFAETPMHPARIARKLCPRARASYIKALERGDALFARHGITTPLRMAHVLDEHQ